MDTLSQMQTAGVNFTPRPRSSGTFLNSWKEGKKPVLNSKTRTAAIMAQNPNIDRADATILANRQWYENPDIMHGRASTADLFGRFSYKNAGIKANAQAQQEGTLAGQYGGGDFGTIFGQRQNRAISENGLEREHIATASDIANLGILNQKRAYMVEDRENEVNEKNLRMIGLGLDNKAKQQSYDNDARQADWDAQDRQVGFDAQSQAQADAQAKAQRDAEGFKQLLAYWREVNPELAAVFDTPESLQYAKNFGFIPNPMIGQSVNGNSDMVYTSPNSATYKPQEQEKRFPTIPSSIYDEQTGSIIPQTLEEIVRGEKVTRQNPEFATAYQRKMGYAQPAAPLNVNAEPTSSELWLREFMQKNNMMDSAPVKQNAPAPAAAKQNAKADMSWLRGGK